VGMGFPTTQANPSLHLGVQKHDIIRKKFDFPLSNDFKVSTTSSGKVVGAYVAKLLGHVFRKILQNRCIIMNFTTISLQPVY